MPTDAAAQHLSEGRDALVHALDGLAEAQLRFTPGPDRWSIAEVVEHLARLGPLDGYQWALFIAAHTIRRVVQIAAIKADARFPCGTCS